MRRPESGFTVVEVLVAMIILTVGALALIQSAAGVTRMLRYGRLGTRAAVVASTRLESLRNDALSTTPTCTALTGGSATQVGNITETWTVSGAGKSRTLQVTVTYPTGRRTASLSVQTDVLCL